MLGRSLRGLASSGGLPGGTGKWNSKQEGEGRACAERGRAVERLTEKQRSGAESVLASHRLGLPFLRGAV